MKIRSLENKDQISIDNLPKGVEWCSRDDMESYFWPEWEEVTGQDRFDLTEKQAADVEAEFCSGANCFWTLKKDIEINNCMSLDEIETTLKSASAEELSAFIEEGWYPGWSLDGSKSPSDRGYFDGTGDLAWTEDEYIVIDMYTDVNEDLICRGFYKDTEKMEGAE